MRDTPLPVKARELLLALERNLLLLMIAAALVAALCAPGPGIAMKTLGFSAPLTFLLFLLQGLSIEAKDFLRGGRILRLFLWGFLLSYVLAPLMGYACSAAFRMRNDDAVGFLLICSMTPTIASGVVISGRAGGEKTTAIALTVVLVFIGMLVIPLSLNALLSRSVEVPRADLARQLVVTVLIPTVLGQAIRLIFPALMEHEAVRRLDKDAPSVLIGLTIYISLAPQADKLLSVSPARVAMLVAASLVVHGALLGSGYLVSRKALAIDRPKSLAVAFVCSQKSLALGAPIWGSLFAAAYPLAILPPIVFHASQIFLDGFLATRAARAAS
jgi:predicted Na+-dependent transporter